MKTWRVLVMPSGNSRYYQGDSIEEKWAEIGRWLRSQGWATQPVSQITVTLTSQSVEKGGDDGART